MELVPVRKQALTRTEFARLADVPPEEEWLANITNGKTRRAYKAWTQHSCHRTQGSGYAI
jgi:hypothetical protein